MSRRLLLIGSGVALVLLLGGLAWLSYATTQRRVHGEIMAFVVQITVVDAAGNPVPMPTLRLIEAKTLEAVAHPGFGIDPRGGVTGDDQGRVELRFAGQPFESEEWLLFWLFPQVIYGPRGFDSYIVDISTAQHGRKHIVLSELLRDEVGTAPTLDGGLSLLYEARVTLP